MKDSLRNNEIKNGLIRLPSPHWNRNIPCISLILQIL